MPIHTDAKINPPITFSTIWNLHQKLSMWQKDCQLLIIGFYWPPS